MQSAFQVSLFVSEIQLCLLHPVCSASACVTRESLTYLCLASGPHSVPRRARSIKMRARLTGSFIWKIQHPNTPIMDCYCINVRSILPGFLWLLRRACVSTLHCYWFKGELCLPLGFLQPKILDKVFLRQTCHWHLGCMNVSYIRYVLKSTWLYCRGYLTAWQTVWTSRLTLRQ